MTAARMPTALLVLPSPDLACMTIFLGSILIGTVTCLLLPTRVIFSFRRNGRFVRSTHVDLHLKKPSFGPSVDAISVPRRVVGLQSTERS